ncbi:MAG: hypothetical protein OEQ29_15770 [Alphaproteobacteria bacterium]|nr:hypothetical protein [Alphaproteobacteria bacterium]
MAEKAVGSRTIEGLTRTERIVEIAFRLIPAVVLFSLAFADVGALRWLSLFGFVPLLLWAAGCQTCGTRRGSCGRSNFPSL